MDEFDRRGTVFALASLIEGDRASAMKRLEVFEIEARVPKEGEHWLAQLPPHDALDLKLATAGAHLRRKVKALERALNVVGFFAFAMLATVCYLASRLL